MFAENARLFGIVPSVQAEVITYPAGVDPLRVTVSELVALQRQKLAAKASSQTATPLKQKVNLL